MSHDNIQINNPIVGDIIERRGLATDFVVGIITKITRPPIELFPSSAQIFTVIAVTDSGIVEYKFWAHTLRDYYMRSYSPSNIELMKKKYLEYQLTEIIEK